MEADLIETLAAPVLSYLATALNTFLVADDLAPTERVLAEFFADADLKARLLA